ncbi:HIT family protein [Haladaptatus cibarius]|uniref:HIT family protein n=1 Tax=Haladaptatus cibarius TaxID=453847 RepID=UPI000678D204|nr:HIT domain-containing protein [Haladaptatus cibarius]
MTCTFCSICAGEEEAEIVNETDETLAFAPLNPISEGHILVIPKDHYETIFDIPESTLCTVVKHTKIIAERLQANGFDGANLLHDSSQHQSVPHFHLHIAPRRSDDGLDLWPESGYEESNFTLTYEHIRKKLSDEDSE